MRIFSTLICMLFLASAAFSQVVLVNSPASIAGSKVWSTGAGSTADLTSNIWTADAVFVDNGTATPTLGCGTLVNGAAIAGKIALIDRGTCSFSEKASVAEAAGAIAVVIFNNAAGAGVIPMGATAAFPVTVPTVMLSYEDGQAIRAELANGPVNITIGNVVFEHDLAIDAKRVSNMYNGVTPANQAELIGLTFIPAVNVLNKGLNDEADIELQAVITHTPVGGSPSEVYSESATLASLQKDSSGVIGLPAYTATEGEGVYNVTYSITSASGDTPEATSDNEFSTLFEFSDNVYTRGRWDAVNKRPFSNIGRTIGGGGNVEFLAGFDVPDGLGHRLDSVKFQIFPQTGTIGGIEPDAVTAYIYEWADANEDSIFTNDEISIVGFAPVTFVDTAATSAWVTAEIYDYSNFEPGGYVVPGDNKKYILGVRYEGSAIVFFGFDDDYDQTVALDFGLIQRDFDLPYIVINGWDANDIPDIEMGSLFTDVGGCIASALFINPYESPSIEVNPSNVAVTLSPNPAAYNLNVESQLKGASAGITYTIRDNAGRMVLSSTRTLNSNYDKTSFDISQLAAGQYFIVVTTDQGITAERFTVQH